MDQSEVLKFEQQQQITKLSQAIRRGHEMIGEASNFFLSDCEGCAIGAAWVGIGLSLNDFCAAWRRGSEEAIAEGLGITVDLFLEVSRMHQSGMPRLQIADWLDNGGSRTC